MISDFVFIDTIEEKTHYSLSLPDPDLYSEEQMILCGDVKLIDDINSGMSTVNINTFSNFKALCVGDIYQRKLFVQTILFIISNKTEVDLRDAFIVLNDFIGSFYGNLEDLDDYAWECEQ